MEIEALMRSKCVDGVQNQLTTFSCLVAVQGDLVMVASIRYLAGRARRASCCQIPIPVPVPVPDPDQMHIYSILDSISTIT